jgi:transcriptional regulator with XRE-family HTH domain
LPDQPSRVRLQLAAELRTARTRAGLSGRELGRAADLSQGMVSRIELVDRLPSLDMVRRWLQACRVDDDVQDRVLALAAAAHTDTQTWRELYEQGQNLQELSRDRNAAARVVQIMDPTVLPGLLQTADYSRHILRLADPLNRMDRAAALGARLERQAVLYEPGRRFEFVIVERLLHWAPARNVLTAQLAQLAAAADLDTVDIAVLPDDFADALVWHNFVIRYPADGSPVYVAAELLHGAQDIHDPDSVVIYQQLWKRLWDAAVTGPAAADMIRKATP